MKKEHDPVSNPTDQTLDSCMEESMCTHTRTHAQGPIYLFTACTVLQRGWVGEQIVHQRVTGFKSMTRGLKEG